MQNFQGVEYLTVPYAEERLTPMGLPSIVLFFWRISATWRKKKRAGESNKGIFEI
jgi:hypothetical protein